MRSGDTLSGIAAQYRVTERQLIVLNALPSADHVEIGQTLKLPSNAVLPQPAARATARVQPAPIKGSQRQHTVARGQTLTQIAKAYDIPMASLISINAIANPNQVKVGTQLMLRASQPQVDSNITAGDSVPAAQASESSSQGRTAVQSQPDSQTQLPNQVVVEEAMTTETVVTETCGHRNRCERAGGDRCRQSGSEHQRPAEAGLLANLRTASGRLEQLAVHGWQRGGTHPQWRGSVPLCRCELFSEKNQCDGRQRHVEKLDRTPDRV